MRLAALSVTQLTDQIKIELESGFSSVEVVGEISNFKPHTSGHRYFTLKDAHSQISAVMWKSRPLGFMPVDGMQVVARGKITVYPPRGTYQLECTSLAPVGLGALQQAFEQLKNKLFDEGLFSLERKKKLPLYPERIGVVTSQTGAAIQDILSTLARRMPSVEIHLRPTIVQGADAPEDIARGIELLNEHRQCDVIIVGRGGGSLEDLWAFNSEIVARAIAESEIPIISAVGHETDVTIADFVADVRAATPTAAAELAVRLSSEVIEKLNQLQEVLSDEVRAVIQYHRERLEGIQHHRAFFRPVDFVRMYQQKTDELSSSLDREIHRALSMRKNAIESSAQILQAKNPLSPLDRGFAYLTAVQQQADEYENSSRTQNILSPDFSLSVGQKVVIHRKNQQAIAEIQIINQ